MERNAAGGGSHLGNSTGYLFGIGVANEVLNMKDLVGMCGKSHGLICSDGALYFSHNGCQERIVTLPSLPLSISLAVTRQHPDYTILTYKLAPSGGENCTTLVGRKIIADVKLKESVLPVFSVSQRVKILFPTFV